VRVILDAGALLAALKYETGGELVDAILLDDANSCLIHAMNACEVFYDVMRASGEAQALETLQGMQAAGLQTREDMDPEFWQDAGRIKADLRRISLADCCAVALARREGAVLVTTDRTELEPVAAAGLCEVQFIR
jgi:PIN domain nuclease of toxin-antitoxin system